MAVGVQLDSRGVTLDQYDEVVERMGLLFGGPMPGAGLFHGVTRTDDGVRAIDVWQSRETFEKFEPERIIPADREIGEVDPPETQFFEVHNDFVGGRWRGKLGPVHTEWDHRPH